jgi:uncharacterized protein YbjT (DUF2867 family)
MPRTILVTGATGNVGAKVVGGLVKAGARVLGAVQSAAKADSIKALGAEPVEFDFNRAESMRAAFQDVEKLFLLTPFVPQMAEFGVRAVEEAGKAGVQYIVRMSALGADSKPAIRLAEWHREVEEAVESSGIPFTILRPNSFMQNYSNYSAQSIRTQGVFYLPAGDGKVSLIDARDIAAVVVETLITVGYEGIAYDLTGPEALSNHEIAETLSRVLGRRIRYVDVSEEDARKGMQQSGMPDWALDALLELYALNKAGRAPTLSPAVQQVTGRKPLTFAQFAKDYATAFGGA